MKFLNKIKSNPTPETRPLMISVTEYGNTIEFAMIGIVKEITKDLSMKIYAMPNSSEKEALLDTKRIWKITKIMNKYIFD